MRGGGIRMRFLRHLDDAALAVNRNRRIKGLVVHPTAAERE